MIPVASLSNRHTSPSDIPCIDREPPRIVIDPPDIGFGLPRIDHAPLRIVIGPPHIVIDLRSIASEPWSIGNDV